MPFAVYFDQVKKKYLVKCDLCGKFLVLNAQRSMLKLEKHREQAKECRKQVLRQMEHHLDEDERLPVFPVTLRFSTHISRLEEERMGVELINTQEYRTKYNLPDSDSLEAPMDVDLDTDKTWDPTSPRRKRASSVLSHASSSASRQPSSSKIQKIVEDE